MFIQNTKSNKEDPATKIMGREFPFNSEHKGNTQEMDSPEQPKPANPNPGATTGHLDSTLPLIKQLARKTSRNKVIINNNLGRKRSAPKVMEATEKVAFVNRVIDILKSSQLEKSADLKGMLAKALQTAVGSRTPGAALKGIGSTVGKGALNWAVPLAAGGATAYKAHEEGMSPFSSGMLGLAAGSVASPKMYSSAFKAGLKSPEGPIPGFMNHLKGPIINKALLTGLAIAPEGISHVNSTLRNAKTISDDLAGSTANLEGTSNKLQASLANTSGNLESLTKRLDNSSSQEAGQGFVEGGLTALGNVAKSPYVWGTAAGLGGLYGGYKLLDKYLQYKAKTEQAKARAMMPPKPPKPNVVNLDDVLARLNRSQHPGIEVPQ